MDSKSIRKAKRAWKRVLAARPNLDHCNPSYEEELAEAQWMVGEECAKIMKHVPITHAKVVKLAQWFIKHGNVNNYPLTKSVKHIHSDL